MCILRTLQCKKTLDKDSGCGVILKYDEEQVFDNDDNTAKLFVCQLCGKINLVEEL